MAYLGLFFIILIATTIQRLDDWRAERQNRAIEKMHAEAYKWIDDNTENLAVARERKAEIDMLINNNLEYRGRKYKTSELKQVTTKKEREARNEAELNGRRYISSDMAHAILADEFHGKPTAEEIWEYTEHTAEERREHYVGCLIEKLGISREDAERRADIFYK